MKLVIKVGTHSILSEDGTPKESVMQSLVQQIAGLQQEGHHVILVTSGAVGAGRQVARQWLGREYGNSLGEKQVLASLGQHELLHVYAHMFREHGMLASQLLLTKQDFQTRQHYLNIARLLQEISKHSQMVAIVNENDSVGIEELMFTDNDELAGLLAAQVNADKLVILSHVEGVYTTHPQSPQATLISTICKEEDWPHVSTVKSEHGKGGMFSKLNTAKKAWKLGITIHIAHVDEPHILKRLMAGENVGTTVLPTKKKSNVKRWIASHTASHEGRVVVNEKLYALLKEQGRVMSLLPVGIQSAEGDFKKGDLIEIASPSGEIIGVGVARYDMKKLMDYCGKKEKPPLIHYDYLHLF